jgi:hypothetical protein
LRKNAGRGFDDASFGLAVMAGLDPAIHVFFLLCPKNVGARDKPGHDDLDIRQAAIRR